MLLKLPMNVSCHITSNPSLRIFPPLERTQFLRSWSVTNLSYKTIIHMVDNSYLLQFWNVAKHNSEQFTN